MSRAEQSRAVRRAQSLTTAHHAKRIRYHHRLLTYQELGDIEGLSATVIANRYRRGKREDQLVAPIRSNKSRPELLSG